MLAKGSIIELHLQLILSPFYRWEHQYSVRLGNCDKKNLEEKKSKFKNSDVVLAGNEQTLRV
jgi:hypothetical protein